MVSSAGSERLFSTSERNPDPDVFGDGPSFLSVTVVEGSLPEIVASCKEGPLFSPLPGGKNEGTGFGRYRRNVPTGVNAKSVSGTSKVTYLTFIVCFH